MDLDGASEWLKQEHLELHVIVNLAHGREATLLPIDRPPLLPCLRALKRAINAGELPAVLRKENPNADVWSSVSLRDLIRFLSDRPDDPSWERLRTFVETWASARGEPFPVRKRRSPNERPWKGQAIDAAFQHFDLEGYPERKAQVEQHLLSWAEERGHELAEATARNWAKEVLARLNKRPS